MKILIDIGHPAHVHYFRHFVKIMELKGHEVLVIARDKEMTHSLLNSYQIKFVTRGKGRSSLLGKMVYVFEADYKIYKFTKKYKPDICLSFSSAYLSHVARALGVPHIIFDDTEHAKLEHIMYVPFSSCILTPASFKKNFGNKHITFRGSMDLAYLHPKYYIANTQCLVDQHLKPKSFFLLRFVNWKASHDIGHAGFSRKGKIKLIELLNNHGQVVISSEKELPKEFVKYSYRGNPKDIHTVIQNALLFVGESGSMSTESAILGTPSIVVNSSLKFSGIFEYISTFGNLFHYDDENNAIEKVKNLLDDNSLLANSSKKAKEYINQNINLTDFIVWFIENYPHSFQTIKNNPDYQNNFQN